MRMPPNHPTGTRWARRPRASMEGGMRMPPNVKVITGPPKEYLLQWRAACACRRISVQPTATRTNSPLQWRAACACRRIGETRTRRRCRARRFNGGRHAHAAESAAFRCEGQADDGASMEGGMRMPPNLLIALTRIALVVLQWRAACACRRMRTQRLANRRERGFNGGRHAHAAESSVPVGTNVNATASMEGGMRMPPNESSTSTMRSACTLQWRAACACRRIPAVGRPGPPSRSFNGGRHAHAAES